MIHFYWKAVLSVVFNCVFAAKLTVIYWKAFIIHFYWKLFYQLFLPAILLQKKKKFNSNLLLAFTSHCHWNTILAIILTVLLLQKITRVLLDSYHKSFLLGATHTVISDCGSAALINHLSLNTFTVYGKLSLKLFLCFSEKKIIG